MHTTSNPSNGRGCGTRDVGAAYLACGVGEDGLPIEAFLFDPVRIWRDGWQRGFRLVQDGGGVYHVVIFVGKSAYPRVWDYVVETSLYGSSRKVPPTFPFHKLTPGKSNMLFAHALAYPKFKYALNRRAPLANCKYPYAGVVPKIPTGWHPDRSPCVFAQQDLAYYIGKVSLLTVRQLEASDAEEEFTVYGPSFSYTGRVPIYPGCAKENGAPGPKDWAVAVFMWLPLTHIEFRDSEDLNVANNARGAGYHVVTLDW